MILIKKWEPTGLLDEMDSVMDMNYVANYLEEMVTLLTRDEKENDEDMPGFFIPMIRRVYSSEEISKAQVDYELAKEIWNELRPAFTNNGKWSPSIPAEQEFMNKLFEVYVAKHKEKYKEIK